MTQISNNSTIKKRAIISGFLGASASAFGKLGLSAYLIDSGVTSWLARTCSQTNLMNEAWCDQVCNTAVRGICVIFMVFINAMMMGSFLEGLEESGSVAAVALSTASNFSVSALYGVLFFKEQVNMMWCVGFIMILIGAFHRCFCGNGVKNYMFLTFTLIYL